MEDQRHFKFHCQNGVENFEIVERWATHLDLGAGLAGPIPWAPRSPDLTVLNFFLCDYVKDFVFSEQIAFLSHMKNSIN